MKSLRRAEVLIAQGRYDLAEREVRDALGSDPENAEALRLLSFVLTESKRPDEGLKIARAALTIEPNTASLHAVLSHALQQLHRLPEAEDASRKALALDPSNAAYHAELADLLYRQHRCPEALSTANNGLSLDPNHVYCLSVRGLAQRALGNLTAAREAFHTALRLKPEDPCLRLHVGRLELEGSDRQSAEDHLREALRLDPNFAQAEAGIFDAIASRHFLPRTLLRYQAWRDRLTRTGREYVFYGLVAICMLIGAAALFLVDIIFDSEPNREIARNIVVRAPLLMMIVVLGAWFSAFLSLRRDSLGRRLLTPDIQSGTLAVGMCVAAIIVSAIEGWWTKRGFCCVPAVTCFFWCLGVVGSIVLSTNRDRFQWRLIMGAATLAAVAYMVVATCRAEHLVLSQRAVLITTGLALLVAWWFFQRVLRQLEKS